MSRRPGQGGIVTYRCLNLFGRRWVLNPADANALVFPSRKGGFLPLGEYRWAFDHACADVGIEGLVPHGVRHTTAFLAISAGANVKVVQRLLGHATAAMTLDRYGHLLNDLIGVADALDKAIDGIAVLSTAKRKRNGMN